MLREWGGGRGRGRGAAGLKELKFGRRVDCVCCKSVEKVWGNSGGCLRLMCVCLCVVVVVDVKRCWNGEV